MENRRSAPRRTAGWNGFCHVEGETASGWRDCRILDISTLGVGIRMQHSRPSDLMGRRVSIELPAVGDAVNIRFEAIEGGEMEDVAAVGNIRDAAAVFHYQNGTWGTGGRALFNMNPKDAIERLQKQFAPVLMTK